WGLLRRDPDDTVAHISSFSFEVKEELAVPLRPDQRRRHRAGQSVSARAIGARDSLHSFYPRGGLANHAPFRHTVAGKLELWLDHEDHVRRLQGGESAHERRERDEGKVCDQQLERTDPLDRERANVRTLEDANPWIVPQRPRELAVGDVDCDDLARAAPQQTIGEAPRRSTC